MLKCLTWRNRPLQIRRTPLFSLDTIQYVAFKFCPMVLKTSKSKYLIALVSSPKISIAVAKSMVNAISDPRLNRRTSSDRIQCDNLSVKVFPLDDFLQTSKVMKRLSLNSATSRQNNRLKINYHVYYLWILFQ